MPAVRRLCRLTWTDAYIHLISGLDLKVVIYSGELAFMKVMLCQCEGLQDVSYLHHTMNPCVQMRYLVWMSDAVCVPRLPW